MFSTQFYGLVFFLLISGRKKSQQNCFRSGWEAGRLQQDIQQSIKGEYFPSNLYVKMLSSRYIYIYNSPTGRVFFQILAPTALEIPISLSMICFYKCLVLENPPVPRKLQSLLSGKYGDSLELHVQTIGVWNSRKLVLGSLWVEFVSWELWTYHIVSL